MRIEITGDLETKVIIEADKMNMTRTAYVLWVLARVELQFPERIPIKVDFKENKPLTRTKPDNFATNWKK